MPIPTAKVTFAINDRGLLQPFVDGKLLEVTNCVVESGIKKPTTARIDILLPEGLVVEAFPSRDGDGQ